MEPPAKRRRLSDSAHSGPDAPHYHDELDFPPTEPYAEPDPDYDLVTKRAEVEHRLQATMARIFEKYSHDFEGIGDEIDMATGKIVVNNGHLNSIRKRQRGRKPKRPPEPASDTEMDGFIADEDDLDDPPDGADLPRLPPNPFKQSHAAHGSKSPRFVASSPPIRHQASPATRVFRNMSSPPPALFGTPNSPSKLIAPTSTSWGNVRRGTLMKSPFLKRMSETSSRTGDQPVKKKAGRPRKDPSGLLAADVLRLKRLRKIPKASTGFEAMTLQPRHTATNAPTTKYPTRGPGRPRLALASSRMGQSTASGSLVDDSDSEEAPGFGNDWLSAVRAQDISLLAEDEHARDDDGGDAVNRRRSGRNRKPPEYFGKVTWIEALESIDPRSHSQHVAHQPHRSTEGRHATNEEGGTVPSVSECASQEVPTGEPPNADQVAMRQRVVPDSQDSASTPRSSDVVQQKAKVSGPRGTKRKRSEVDAALDLSDEEAPVLLSKYKNLSWTMDLADRSAGGPAKRQPEQRATHDDALEQRDSRRLDGSRKSKSYVVVELRVDKHSSSDALHQFRDSGIDSAMGDDEDGNDATEDFEVVDSQETGVPFSSLDRPTSRSPGAVTPKKRATVSTQNTQSVGGSSPCRSKAAATPSSSSAVRKQSQCAKRLSSEDRGPLGVEDGSIRATASGMQLGLYNPDIDPLAQTEHMSYMHEPSHAPLTTDKSPRIERHGTPGKPVTPSKSPVRRQLLSTPQRYTGLEMVEEISTAGPNGNIGLGVASPSTSRAIRPRPSDINLFNHDATLQPHSRKQVSSPRRLRSYTPQSRSDRSMAKGSSKRRSLISLISKSHHHHGQDDGDDSDELGRADDTTMSVLTSRGVSPAARAPSLAPELTEHHPWSQTPDSAANNTTTRKLWKSSALTREVLRTPVRQRHADFDPDSEVRTPGGTVRICGVDSYRCGRDFCFTCL